MSKIGTFREYLAEAKIEKEFETIEESSKELPRNIIEQLTRVTSHIEMFLENNEINKSHLEKCIKILTTLKSESK